MEEESIRPQKKILDEYSAFVKGDTAFAAYARLLQSKWRNGKKLPMGHYKNVEGKPVFIGNYLDRSVAKDKGANFLTKKTRKVVEETLATKEKGAQIFEDRLFANLLSSQPLAFNLFGELSLDLKMATKLFTKLLPDRKIEKVNKIIFEHSDGRGDCEYTCDSSAFDVFVEYQQVNSKLGFIGIEVKYAESLTDKPSSHKKRYEELFDESGIFRPDSLVTLKQKPLQQIWRDHLLSIAHQHHKNKKYNTGLFVYLFPKQNNQCKEAVSLYIKQFKSFDKATEKHNEAETGFYPRHLEDFIKALIEVYENEPNNGWTKKLKYRYLGE